MKVDQDKEFNFILRKKCIWMGFSSGYSAFILQNLSESLFSFCLHARTGLFVCPNKSIKALSTWKTPHALGRCVALGEKRFCCMAALSSLATSFLHFIFSAPRITSKLIMPLGDSLGPAPLSRCYCKPKGFFMARIFISLTNGSARWQLVYYRGYIVSAMLSARIDIKPWKAQQILTYPDI